MVVLASSQPWAVSGYLVGPSCVVGLSGNLAADCQTLLVEVLCWPNRFECILGGSKAEYFAGNCCISCNQQLENKQYNFRICSWPGRLLLLVRVVASV